MTVTTRLMRSKLHLFSPQIFCKLPMSISSPECLCSTLKRVIMYLRTTMSDVFYMVLLRLDLFVTKYY